MFIVTVTFTSKPEFTAEFGEALLGQAKNSLELEEHCTRFDICVKSDDPAVFFLYEIYADEAAFEYHLKSEHFLSFSKLVAPWTVDKQVGTWQLKE